MVVSLTLERVRVVEDLFFHDRASEQSQGTLNTITVVMVFSVPYRNKGCMVDALASRSDEGRDMAAIRFGKVPNNL